MNRAMLLSLAPNDHFDKKRNLVETIEGALIVFTYKFKPFLEAMPSETIVKEEDFKDFKDFICRKLSRKKPKITKLEFLLLFVIFLKMHSSLDDHEASIMRINFIVDILWHENNKILKIKRLKKMNIGEKYNPNKYNRAQFESDPKTGDSDSDSESQAQSTLT